MALNPVQGWLHDSKATKADAPPRPSGSCPRTLRAAASPSSPAREVRLAGFLCTREPNPGSALPTRRASLPGNVDVNKTTRNAPEAFRRGYLDAWSIRDDEPTPPVPAYSVEPGEDPYRAGVARAVRDAATKALGSARQRWPAPRRRSAIGS
jgi:hypothetical protein